MAQNVPELNWNERQGWVNVREDLETPAFGDGKEDDTRAIQTAIGKLDIENKDIRKRKSAVYLPPGTYVISETLELKGKIGISIIGSGSKTKIIWKGAKGGIMFRSNGNNYSKIIGIQWDGNNLASVGVLHSNKGGARFETRIRHEYEAFYNLEYGIHGALPSKEKGSATAETMVLNCMFEDVSYPISLSDFNYYNWIIDGCLFRRSKIAVNAPYGTFFARNSNFELSSESDFLLGVLPNAYTIRRCSSLGSKQFIKNKSTYYLASLLVVENCFIKNWTADAAIVLLARGPSFIMDCSFEKEGFVSPPVQVLRPRGQGYNLASNDGKIHRLITSGNKINGKLINKIFDDFGRTESVDFVNILPAKVKPVAITPKTIFFNGTVSEFASTPSAPVLNILDEIPISVNPEREDISKYVQVALGKIKSMGTGAILYFPTGRYLLSNTIMISGQDYVFQGSGFSTEFIWKGDLNQPMISIDNGNNIFLEQFRLNFIEPLQTYLIHHKNTRKRESLIVYDGVYHNHNPNPSGKNTSIQDICFENLSSADFVFMRHIEMSPHVKNSSAATFLVDNFINYYQTSLKVSGDCKNRARWFNMLTSVIVGSSSSPEIIIEDNNSITITDMYNESGKNHIFLTGGGKCKGQVTIQGIKQDFLLKQNRYDTILYSNGYNGTLFYGPQFFNNVVTKQKIIIEKGNLEVFFVGVANSDTLPGISKKSGSVIFQQSIRNIKSLDRDQIIGNTPLTVQHVRSYQNAMDDIRAAGNLDVAVKYKGFLRRFIKKR